MIHRPTWETWRQQHAQRFDIFLAHAARIEPSRRMHPEKTNR